MADQDSIRRTVERNIQVLSAKPSRGFLTGVTKARLVDGLRCEVEEGPWRFSADLPCKAGGEDTAPTPGALGRGALASCLAMEIALWAARLGIPIDALEVEVQADFDARGELGVGHGIPPGYTEVRYTVSIESRASHHDIGELLDLAERHSPYLDVFGRAMALSRVVHLNGEET
jgi:uncharacterized OsmC-like protein